jgi:hypothetical protein
MSEDDVLFGFRLRLFTLAEELGTSRRPVGRWGRPLDLLPPQAQGRQLGPRGAQGARAPAAANAERDRPSSRAADRCLRARPSRPRAKADLRRAGPREMGRDPDLRAQGLARPVPGRAQHPFAAPGPDRPSPRPLRERKPRTTSSPQSRARRCSSTAYTSAGCRAPRAPSGNTPRSTSPPPTPGPSSAPRSATPERADAHELVHRVARELKAAGGKLREVAQTTAPSSAPSDSARRSRRPAPASASSRRAGQTRTAASGASS